MKSKRSHRKQKPQGNEKEPFFTDSSKVESSDNSPFFQTKLEISPAHDPAEKEADEVANEIVDAPSAQNGGQTNINRKEKLSRQAEEEEEPAQAKRIQKQEEEEMQAKRIQKQEEEEPQAKRIQKQGKEEEETMQTKRIQKQEEEEEPAQAKRIQKQEEEEPQAKLKPNVQARPTTHEPSKAEKDTTAPASFEKRLEETKGQGFALPDDLRLELEDKFGARLKNVRIHTDAEAVALCQSIQAQAFTHGYHIYFNQGKYQPHTTEGMRLLAHEMTHVLQQKGKGEG